ncbi:MAG TPA: hypothetical protein VGF48_04455 [Thermoanaerobaculia bacterium]|jgi:hypothetical protein
MARATALLLVLFTSSSCARVLPWRNEPIGEEVNFAFVLRDNLVELESLRIDNQQGRFLLGTAAPVTVVDPSFPLLPGRTHTINLASKQSVRITPQRVAMGGVADGIIGADTWRRAAVTIDYRSGLVTYQKSGIHPAQMTLYRFSGAPAIAVGVDGREVQAIVDTTSPDTMVLPRATAGRGTVSLVIASIDFGPVDVQYAPVTQARIGNRLLSRFLVTVDYGRGVVGLWRDPRIPQ